MKKFKKNLKGIITELGFTRGQVKLTVGFCIACAGVGWLGAMWAGLATLIGFAAVATIWFVSMFDIEFRGIPREEFKRTQKKPETVATVSDDKQNMSKGSITQ